MIIYQYRPAYFSGFKNEVAEVDSFKELMEIEWIKSWSESRGFHKYSISVDKDWEK